MIIDSEYPHLKFGFTNYVKENRNIFFTERNDQIILVTIFFVLYIFLQSIHFAIYSVLISAVPLSYP